MRTPISIRLSAVLCTVLLLLSASISVAATSAPPSQEYLDVFRQTLENDKEAIRQIPDAYDLPHAAAADELTMDDQYYPFYRFTEDSAAIKEGQSFDDVLETDTGYCLNMVRWRGKMHYFQIIGPEESGKIAFYWCSTGGEDFQNALDQCSERGLTPAYVIDWLWRWYLVGEDENGRRHAYPIMRAIDEKESDMRWVTESEFVRIAGIQLNELEKKQARSLDSEMIYNAAPLAVGAPGSDATTPDGFPWGTFALTIGSILLLATLGITLSLAAKRRYPVVSSR